MRLLLADDEPIEREALRFLLEGSLPSVTVVGEAASGREAVAQVESLRPDVLLLDIEMPGLSGLEALRLIRERAPSTRCLVVSAYDTFQYAREAMRGGAVDYLLKPVRAEQMIEVLGRLAAEIEAERRGRADALRQLEQIRQLRPLAEAELVLRVERGEGTSWEDLLEAAGRRFEAGLALAIALEGVGAPSTQAYLWLSGQVRAMAPCAVGALQEDRFLILVEHEGDVQTDRLQRWSLELGRTLRERAWDLMQLRVRVGIGTPGTGAAALHRSAREALTALRSSQESLRHALDATALEEGGASSRSAPSPAAVRAVEEGKRYMQTHFTEALSLEQIAGPLALSPQYYSKLFTRLTGQTVMEFLTDCRMGEAKRLLADPVVPIKTIGYRIGYQDPNYFTRVFKKVTGQTPTEYRADRLGAPPGPAQS